MFRSNTLKARLGRGESIYGAWVGSGSPTNAEILAHVGFDFLVIDHEHGMGSIGDAAAALRATECPAPLVSCVRPGTTRCGSSASSMRAPRR